MKFPSDWRNLDPRVYTLGALMALAAVGLGALLGYAGVIITLGVLGALAAALWVLTSLEVGLWGVMAIITLLPFGALPFKVVVTPTFLDLAMLAVVAVYVFQWMAGRRRQIALTPAHAPLALFLALAVFSFVAGMSNGPLTSNLMRHFVELLFNVAFVFVIVDYLASREKLDHLVLVIILCGTLAAVIGIVFYILPETLSERLLSALRVFNYPSGGVLRYIEDNPDNAQRAIGTSVDPNVLGGLLALVGALMAPQLVARRPVFRWRWLTWGAFGVVVTCLLLTYSRTALAALGVGLAGIALARYRRLLWLIGLVALVIVLLPATQTYVVHFLEGLQGQDLATQMRFGEYKDALILIGRHPWLGVGFAGAGDIDVYLGVSSAYLIMAEEMGLVGLAGFGLIIAAVLGWSLVNRQAVYADERLTPVWLGAHAGLAAALTVGLADHYFFNIDFQPSGAIFWIFVGLCLAATRLAAPTPR
jgi:polysaccharide biosynthesis protein PslJ